MCRNSGLMADGVEICECICNGNSGKLLVCNKRTGFR